MTVTILAFLAGCSRTGLTDWDDYLVDTGGSLLTAPDDGDTTEGDTESDDGGSDGGGSDGGASGGGSGDGADGGGSGGGETGGSASGSAPVVTYLNATETDSGLEVAFEVEDADGDLSGGVLEITVNSVKKTFELGSTDLADWNPSGTSTVVLPLDPCSAGENLDIEAVVVDTSGLVSAPRTKAYTLMGWGDFVSESGDTDTSATSVGPRAPRIELCGDIDAASHAGGGYTGDMDWIEFEADATGTWGAELTWVASDADYDVYWMDGAGNTLSQSSEPGPIQPEGVTMDVEKGKRYYLVVAGWDGGVGDWHIDIN